MTLATPAFVGTAQAQATLGCPEAHCDRENSDFANIDVPSGTVDVVWTRNDPARTGENTGSGKGLGCSANGTIAICSFVADINDNVIAYDYFGNRPYESNLLFNGTAGASAPLILESGSDPLFVAADNNRIVRRRPSVAGSCNRTGHDAGVVISPVRTSNDIIILAGTGNTVTAVDNSQLDCPFIEKRVFEDVPGEIWSTNNTPGVSGNRVFITQQYYVNGQLDEKARLLAIDVDPSAPPGDILADAWSAPFEFFANPMGGMAGSGVGSRSSPLVVGGRVIFDGYTKTPSGDYEPTIFAVDESTGLLDWSQKVLEPTFASFAADPTAAYFWHLMIGTGVVTRRSTITGAPDYNVSFDVGGFIDSDPSTTHIATSAITIAGTQTDPVMLIAARETVPLGANRFLLAVELNTKNLRWSVPLQGVVPQGQFPIVTDGNSARVIFSGSGPGVRAIGVPEP